jgi:hypothetical protein
MPQKEQRSDRHTTTFSEFSSLLLSWGEQAHVHKLLDISLHLLDSAH